MTAGITLNSIIPIRKEASHKSEMVSQLLFGETYQILDKYQGWLEIESNHDQYPGYINQDMSAILTPDDFEKINQEEAPVMLGELIETVTEAESGQTLNLVAGSMLPFFNHDSFLFGPENNKYKAGHLVKSFLPDFNKPEKILSIYLNAPYLWGGRSPFGIDCSGLVQILYKSWGILLPRDASQQVEKGKTLSFLDEADPGDLAFFDNEEGQITHVGIILENSRILHASGRVRIDKLDHQGIYNKDLDKYTHKLRVLKRIK
ncbi:MAG TPA: C40 family peptidase [Bacteroidales bacterium]|nr:C40 family peptidase [Bacteroidales bacterium]